MQPLRHLWSSTSLRAPHPSERLFRPAWVCPVVINGVVYDRVPVSVLFTTGPRYTEPSGVRIGRGSVIPEWLAADPMRNVSIRRLRPGRFYNYFVSPDDKVVIFDPASRRVARIVRRPG